MSYISTAYRFIKPIEFELITQKILRQANYDLSGKNIERVPIEEIIEFDFGLEFVWEDISHLENDTTDVYAFILPEEKKIILNEAKRELFNKYIGALNFTYAHELGHYVLHTSAGKQLNLFAEEKFLCRAENKYDPVEYQANQFASCLLIPLPILEVTVFPLIDEGILQWQDLYKLKDQLEVSTSALVYRLEKLKKIKVIDKKIMILNNTSKQQLKFNF